MLVWKLQGEQYVKGESLKESFKYCTWYSLLIKFWKISTIYSIFQLLAKTM